MAEPDITKHKKEESDDEIVNRTHTVTPDPDDDPGVPKVGVVEDGAEVAAARPKKRTADNGPMNVGVNFDSSET